VVRDDPHGGQENKQIWEPMAAEVECCALDAPAPASEGIIAIVK
jgi:hypothetical protein